LLANPVQLVGIGLQPGVVSVVPDPEVAPDSNRAQKPLAFFHLA
jgi:hypothetical protein